MTTFRQLLDQFDRSAATLPAKGRRFERFCREYFRSDPLWSDRFDEVWEWSDWPGRDNAPDTGVDLVARERGTGDLVAIQCKFYSPTASLDWRQVSTFAGMMGYPDFASGMIVSTAGRESANVHRNLDKVEKDVSIWRVDDFEESRVDWDHYELTDSAAELPFREGKSLRPHQAEAIADVVQGFATADRGQMIMACGTGKTFTSLRLAEQAVGVGGTVLFLVPSINLLSQSVQAWAADASVPLATFAVCSDAQAGRKADEDMSANDLAIPASTDVESLIRSFEARASRDRMSVVFSTYQSIDVITEAQAEGLARFDLIVCDEAHRTTGAIAAVEKQSAFTKVHFNENVDGVRRLYMTATPRIYGDQAKAKAADRDVLVASMDDPSTFGEVFHELSFGDAVAQKLLSDYKVLVLAVNEGEVAASFQRQLASGGNELGLNDVARLVGVWHALSKRGPQFGDDAAPMRRAVSFTNTIESSKQITELFPKVVDQALERRSDANSVRIEGRHVDGKTNVKVRSESIAWLEEPPGQGVCRMLSNARCLTEGVDIPALDAVVFMHPRKSLVDIVQAVGRVMRLAEGKELGYVILPVAVPAGVPPEQALSSHETYDVVWQVLQALRSHDERLAAEINRIDINGTSDKVNVIGVGVKGGDDVDGPGVTTTSSSVDGVQLQLPDLDEWRDALYARIVEKVGDRHYMANWADDIAQIAASQESRIRALLAHPDQNPEAVERFATFTEALRNNLNDSIGDEDAIGMLSQHLITRPVFEALFGHNQFIKSNPVSVVMDSMIATLDDANLATETASLEGFYEHIRGLIGGIDTPEGRQHVITELYEKFFRKALPKTVQALGIVYTPIEIVDFINRSVNDLLHTHFDDATISDDGVHVLDPFTGTGTFISRLLQSGLIKPEDLDRKYRDELHANELVLFAYYIAAINIETTYNTLTQTDGYTPFEGIVLTDTFQLSEDGDPMDHVFFPRNNERADKQKTLDIRVIVGNPPYSVGQSSQNDNNQNLDYPTLDASIADTYADRSSATNKNSLYDSYIRAIRWASDRIQASPDGGIVGFVSNGGWLDGNTAAGIRLTLADEFHHIYIYNLRGNQRTSGEQSRREGGKVFGSGSRNTVAISLLVRQPGPPPVGGAQIHYRDIGNYLDRQTKLETIARATITNLDWAPIEPNTSGDWINQRDSTYDTLIPLTGEGGIFHTGSNGLKTGRDAWVYNSSAEAVRARVLEMDEFYNQQLEEVIASQSLSTKTAKARAAIVADTVHRDPEKFSWNERDFDRLGRGERSDAGGSTPRDALYRPFFKQRLAFESTLNQRRYQLPKLYPTPESPNHGMSVVDPGNSTPFAVIATNKVPDLVAIGDKHSKHFARWRYEESDDTDSLFGGESGSRVSNLKPDAIRRFQVALGSDIYDDAVFHYVYGALHSPEFRRRYEANLKKEAPRVPMPPDRATFDAYSDAGAQLMELHIGYESVEPYELTEEWRDGANPDLDPSALRVESKKMRYPKVTEPDTGKKVPDRTRLIYNSHLTVGGIPERAHDYKLGTRSGIDWITDRYYIKTDKKSGIVNDPNAWADEHDDARYILDLIGRVTTVSLRTLDIVESLPLLLSVIAETP